MTWKREGINPPPLHGHLALSNYEGIADAAVPAVTAHVQALIRSADQS